MLSVFPTFFSQPSTAVSTLAVAIRLGSFTTFWLTLMLLAVIGFPRLKIGSVEGTSICSPVLGSVPSAIAPTVPFVYV